MEEDTTNPLFIPDTGHTISTLWQCLPSMMGYWFARQMSLSMSVSSVTSVHNSEDLLSNTDFFLELLLFAGTLAYLHWLTSQTMKAPKQLQKLGLLFFSASLLAVNPVQSQVYGCRDPLATNFNSAATVNNGSCLYNITNYTPPVKVDPISTALRETSGLQMAGNFLWSFNDGGNATAIYRMDTVTNAILQTVNLSGVTNVDWEDIAFDGTFFYIGDFGNNANGARTDLKIYKFPFSAIPDYMSNPVVSISSSLIEVINFTYSDQAPVVPTTANNTKFDCEAMLADGGKLHLFTKNWVDNNTTHYIINGTAAGTYVATPLETLTTGYLVTGADKIPGMNVVVLLGYQNSGTGSHFLYFLSDFQSGHYFNGNKRRIDLPDALTMGQAEGIAFCNSGYGYISSEQFTRTVFGFPITINQKLRAFNTNDFISLAVLPTELLKFRVENRNDRHLVNWEFASNVQQMKIMKSEGQSRSFELATYSNSSSGQLLTEATGERNCYVLSWSQPDGSRRFSNTICLNNVFRAGFHNMILQKNGCLSFTFKGDPTGEYWFRLLTLEGKQVCQTKRTLLTGSQTFSLCPQPASNGLMIVQVFNNKEQRSFLLPVE